MFDIGTAYENASIAVLCRRRTDGNIQSRGPRMRVAQPSLSQQILKLEEELGDRLFERTQRRVLLTTAGSLFLPYAKSILEAADRARQEIREMGRPSPRKDLSRSASDHRPIFFA
jgi:DNA-binding transcriptional LysR family regulator